MGYRNEPPRGYRVDAPPPRPKPQRSMQDLATPGKVYIHNGSTAHLAIPCWYKEVRLPEPVRHHSRSEHDHAGWPAPDKPDRICQAWDFTRCCCKLGHHYEKHHAHGSHGCGHDRHCKHFIDLTEVFPIHLTEEGYTRASVSFNDKPTGLTCTASIDKEDDWIIRLLFDAQTQAKTEPLFFGFCVRAHRGTTVTDTVMLGKGIILPAPLD